MRNAVHPRFYPFMCRILIGFPGSIPHSERMALSGAQVVAVTLNARTYLTDLAIRVDLSGGVNA